ncbi:sensor histidine kinase [Chengkuizengella sp. 2205SS18-9]|uniref:Signal transduction histidine-protein kinase/phosphatase DegS n=1 Tax=Chengkuizengella axinellae TaxID=3064388 RepID=A0ABT9J2M9_9BACL|nr:sensor histidine kinase [Chengkuizengella sp. 2205SS18-9]MDP5275869.1 sensor histidine kinase [Chengkuizengella sp. 2205SS18-9]
MDAIDKVITKTMEVMDDSKYQIYEISESARTELEVLNQDLSKVMSEIDKVINIVDDFEIKFRDARNRLSEVSRDLHRYGEVDIRKAYETANSFQIELIIYREKEKNLKDRRDDLHQRIKNIEGTIHRAETVVSQMNVVLDYLQGDLNQVSRILETAKNRQLIGLKIILALEEERKRISREIHDGIAQSMANLVLRTEIVERMLSKEKYDSLMGEFVDFKHQMRTGLEEVRKIIFNLRPMALDDLGLVPALRKYLQVFEEKYAINTSIDVHGQEIRISSAMEVAIYRFVQEFCSNTYKHANASQIKLGIFFEDETISISLQDDGIGFEIDQMDQKILEGNHYGIIGMRERVELLEGDFEIRSASNQGTQITMKVPVNENEEKE